MQAEPSELTVAPGDYTDATVAAGASAARTDSNELVFDATVRNVRTDDGGTVLLEVSLPGSETNVLKYGRKRLGKGGFGEVLCGEWQGLPVAVKSINMPKINQHPTYHKCLKREIEIQPTIDCAYIVRSFFAVRFELRGADSIVIAMELCDGGTLEEQIRKTGRLGDDHTIHLLHDMSAALEYLSEKGLCHRDIKAPNVLRHKAESDRRSVFKLSDLGLLRKVSPDDMGETVCGTAKMFPPEMLPKEGEPLGAAKEYGTEVDMWSFGLMLYRCITGRYLINGADQNEVFAAMQQWLLEHPDGPGPGLFGQDDTALSASVLYQVRLLMDRMLQKNGDRRLDVVTLRQYALELESSPAVYVFQTDTCQTICVRGVAAAATMAELHEVVAQRCLSAADGDFMLVHPDAADGGADPRATRPDEAGDRGSPVFLIRVAAEADCLTEAVEMDYSVVGLSDIETTDASVAMLQRRGIDLLSLIFRDAVAKVAEWQEKVTAQRVALKAATAQGAALYRRVALGSRAGSSKLAEAESMADDADRFAQIALANDDSDEFRAVLTSLDRAQEQLGSSENSAGAAKVLSTLNALVGQPVRRAGGTMYGRGGLRDAFEALTRGLAVSERLFGNLIAECAAAAQALSMDTEAVTRRAQLDQAAIELASREERTAALAAKERELQARLKATEHAAAAAETARADRIAALEAGERQLVAKIAAMEEKHSQRVRDRLDQLQIAEQLAEKVGQHQEAAAATQGEAAAAKLQRDQLHSEAVALTDQVAAMAAQAVAQRERLAQIETHTLECMAKRATVQTEIETAEQTKKAVAEETDDLLSMHGQLGRATAEKAQLGARLQQATAALDSANKAAARALAEKNAVCLSQQARITELAELAHSKQRRVNDLELGMQDAAIKLAASERRVRDADRAVAAAGGADGVGRVLAEGRADTGDLVILYRRRSDGMWAVANSPSGTILDPDTFWGDSLSTITTDDRVVVLAKVVMRNASGSIIVEMFAPAVNLGS